MYIGKVRSCPVRPNASSFLQVWGDGSSSAEVKQVVLLKNNKANGATHASEWGYTCGRMSLHMRENGVIHAGEWGNTCGRMGLPGRAIFSIIHLFLFVFVLNCAKNITFAAEKGRRP